MQALQRIQSNSIDKSDVIHLFCSQFQTENTKKAYTKELHSFFNYLIFHKIPVTKVKPLVIDGYLTEFSSLSTSSINFKISCLKSFFKWLEANDMIEKNPARSIKVKKANTTKPTLAFSDEEVQKILRAPDKESFIGNYHNLVLTLLFFTGIRRSELVNIKLKDILQDRDHTILKITGKGNKTRMLPLSEAVLTEIKRYLEQYSELTDKKLTEDDYLIQSSKNKINKAINACTVFRIVKRYAKMIGVDRRVSPHSCRATAISHLLEKDISLRNVADFAGHTSTVTTQLYDKKRDGYKNSAAYKIQY